MLPSKQEKHRKKHFLINVAIGLIIVLIAAVFALNTIQVPYTYEERYPVEEAYEELEFYNSTESYDVLVPAITYVETERHIPIGTPSDKLETPPHPRRDKDCHLVPYNFTVNYTAPAEERNQYDPITKAGYWHNAVRTLAKICNKERHSMSTDLLICNYVGDTKVDCIDRLKTTVPANSCLRKMLIWITPFGEHKTSRLEMGEVSQKLICRTTFVGSGKAGPAYSVISHIPYAGKDYNAYTKENVRLKTKSGYLATPASLARYTFDEVASARQKEVQDVVTYKSETRERPVTLNRTITKTRTAEKKRTLTGYRTLWEELLVRYENWCTANEMC